MNVDRHQIRITAEQDAQNDANKLLWFVAGLALNVIGLLIAYVYEASPPATRLLENRKKSYCFTQRLINPKLARSR